MNAFFVGPVVPPDKIIGYRRMREDLEAWAFGPSCGISLTGMHRTGKTSLAKEIIRKIQDNKESKILPVYVVLNKIVKEDDCDWFGSLLHCIIDELEDQLIERDLVNVIPGLSTALHGFRTTTPSKNRFRTYFERVFKTMAGAGWKTCIIMDEFDYAVEPDTFRGPQDFELFRDLPNQEHGVSLLLISRRELHMIEKSTRQNSVFSGAFNRFGVVGFRETDGRDGSETHRDMTEYYAVLRDNYDIELTEEEKQELRFYTGWNPFLLSIFGFEMAQDSIEKREKRSLQTIFAKKLPIIQPYLDTVYKRLEADESSDDKKYIHKLMGIVIGPSIDVAPNDIDLLQSLGFLQPSDDTERAFKCISGLFTQYLRNKSVQVDTWGGILETERIARRMIEREFQPGETHLTQEQWFTILAEAFRKADNQPDFNRSVYLRDIRVNWDSYNVQLSVLDVISLKDCFRIIRAFWDSNFARYFAVDPENGKAKSGNLEQWKMKFAECGKARNPIAHGHPEFLDANARNNVNSYCKEIIQAVMANMEATEPAGVPASLKLPQGE